MKRVEEFKEVITNQSSGSKAGRTNCEIRAGTLEARRFHTPHKKHPLYPVKQDSSV